ncbi:MAG: sugar phosphate isomerase/epimerase family protein, partial [Bacteroidota bacterium]
MKTTRREFVKRSMFAAAASLSVASAHQTFAESGRPPVNINDIDDHTISVFSKNLQWLDYDNMAKVAAEIGFDGIDLTVRPNGHVLPERVAEDLPKAVRAVRSAGLEVYTITTAISEASHEHTEAIVASASELGIGHYRMNWLAYDKSLSVSQNLGNFKTKLDELAKLNEKYNIHGAYQNHAGLSLGSPLWDLWMLIKDI